MTKIISISKNNENKINKLIEEIHIIVEKIDDLESIAREKEYEISQLKKEVLKINSDFIDDYERIFLQ